MPHIPARRAPLPREPLFLALYFEDLSAQVIAAYDPAYAGRQYAVAGRAAADGLAAVLAQSPWVRTERPLAGMPLHVLRRQWPNVEIVARNTDFERAALAELRSVYERYTPVFTVDRNGASLLDLTAAPAQRRGAEKTIETLKKEIRGRAGLTVIAAGAGASALIARVMARSARPAGAAICPAGNEEAMLDTLDVRLLPGLSAACRERLAKYGLRSTGQIRRLGRGALVTRFGAEGELLYAMTNGKDARPAAPPPSPALSAESILEQDTNDAGLLSHTVRVCADRLCHGLRTARLSIDRLTMTIVYRDSRKAQKTASFSRAIDDFSSIAATAVKMFETLYTRRVGVRAIRLAAKRPTTALTGQTELFETRWEEKQRMVSESIVDVRNRMDFNAVSSASDLLALRHGKTEVR